MEKKRVSKKLIIIIAVIAVLVVGAVSVGSVVIYRNYQTQQMIETAVTEIAEDYALFENTEDREEKLILLSEMESEYEAYIADKNSEEYSDEVKAEYEKYLSLMRGYFTSEYDVGIDANTIATLDEAEREDIKSSITNLTALDKQISEEAAVTLNDEVKLSAYNEEISVLVNGMRQFFVSQYDAVIKENTVEDVEKTEDKEKLSDAIENLDELKALINEEADITVADAEVLEGYNNSIDGLTKSYEERIKEIEEAEKKAAAEASKQEDVSYSDDSYSDYGDYSNNNDSLSNNSSTVGINPNNPNCVGEGHGGLHHSYTSEDENGNPTGNSYFYNDKCAYDYDKGISWVWGDLW